MIEKRHTCVICGSKRNESNMENVFGNSWACRTTKYSWSFISSVCTEHSDINLAKQIIKDVAKLKKIRPAHLFNNVGQLK